MPRECTARNGKVAEFMNVLIAYYSRSGNNEKLAIELQERMKCDIEKIVDTVNRKGVLGWLKSGRQAHGKQMSKIEPTTKDPGNYDLVVVCCPFWAGLMPPPMRTYLSENKGKFNTVALMSVSGGGKGNDKTIPDFEETIGKEFSAILMLSQAEKKKGGYEERLQQFSSLLSKANS